MSAAIRACGVITITTDFGHQGPFVGVMKGCMLSRFPQARIVDLTHEILVHWPAEAGFWLSRAFSYFPAGTVHVAVVDPGVGTSRDMVIVSGCGHLFFAPDNGLLAPLLGRCADASITRLQHEKLARFGIRETSATFHGRDILAPLAAELAAGRCVPQDLGEPVESLVPAWVDEPSVDAGVTGVVITIDHFGNLITNIDAALMADIREPRVHAGHHTFPMRRTYADVQPGEYMALINSFGVLEIARAQQSAADGLGLSRGAPVTVHDAAQQAPLRRS